MNQDVLKKAFDELLKGKTGEGSRGGQIVGHTKGGKPIYLREKSSHAFGSGNASNFGYQEQENTFYMDGEPIAAVPKEIVDHKGDLGFKMAQDPEFEKKVMNSLQAHLKRAKEQWAEIGANSAIDPKGEPPYLDKEFDKEAYEKSGGHAFEAAMNHSKQLPRYIDQLKEEVKRRREQWERDKNQKIIILPNR